MSEGGGGGGHVEEEREGLKAGRAVMPESLRTEISTSLFYSGTSSDRLIVPDRAPFSLKNHARVSQRELQRRKLLVKSCGLTPEESNKK